MQMETSKDTQLSNLTVPGLPGYDSAYSKLRRVSCQITGQMVSYERSEGDKNYSVFYCSMFFFLLSSFICGIIMTAFGGMSIITFPYSWIPIWLLVEGLDICLLFIILFMGENKRLYYCKKIFSFTLFIFLSVWSFLGIFWSITDTTCSQVLNMFSLTLSIIFAIFVLISLITWIYWCYNSSP